MSFRDRPVIFWAWKNRPSFTMRGMQVAEALKARGIKTEIRIGYSWKALKDVKDSIIVCVKSTPRLIGWLSKANNKIIYDAIDFTSLRDVPNHASAVITGTEYMRNLLAKELPKHIQVKTIYHHCDPHLKPHVAGEDSLKLMYNGAKESSKFLKGEIPQLTVVSFMGKQDWREQSRQFNAHFSARLDMTKSVIKLANVASMNAIYLTGREPGCVELLGQDYPFYLREPLKLEKVLEDVNKLQTSVGTPTWKDAKERIRNSLPLLTIEATAKSYENLFEQL